MSKLPQRSEEEAGSLLGTYLLQGWVMTDKLCPVTDCSYPLMRSKDGSISFCTLHDPLPNKPTSTTTTTTTNQKKPLTNNEPVADQLALQRQRREQSSKASQLIGEKMLQRWTLLNEHCPNDTCYAIPLVRHPETKQMYCVICENIIDPEGQQQQEVKKNENIKQQKKEDQSIKQETVNRTIAHKRQKTTTSSVFSTKSILSTLAAKMDYLNEEVKETYDPSELAKLFDSIKSCAQAIEACVEAGKVYDKTLGRD
ncbi:hypothetical protein BCV72DRAFT_253342 [Rhizopus microsporus var. microsporus]|uniref:Uncharacterized protein n=2 Tax=Rhizopus microsporus TaxID=58291 RepID=A0A2G4SS71_RHIZD|nr:uncharacterized protein RHIMIDRAFT_238674 [Rhizopus microsporus ATCC 52813]ORE00985.1 hypothetical protein BCV72DRAFT_253342 [Rhizopus microsporus var. microsporus]PHZ11236.1 hypothetical protein RHIMIDRAFT_238674 [Rhizopus microsporus ATCC 52813]